jgi:hypothetical protein
MSTLLDELRAKLEQLSVNELLSLQEQIIQQLRARTLTNGNGHTVKTNSAYRHVDIPGVRHYTAKEIEAELAEIFTPEELAEINNTDPATLNLPPLPKSLAEMISEDREDRF